MRSRIIESLFLIIVAFCLSYCKQNKPSISVIYSIDRINSELLKITFWLTNNDSVDYFIPFIKPAGHYSTFYDKNSSKEMHTELNADFFLSNNWLSRKDLVESAQLDSMYYSEREDTIYFYFEESFVKKYYDSILIYFKDRNDLHFIYPYFYHALGNSCVYLRKGETKGIINYVVHYFPVDTKYLLVGFNFNTDSIFYYKEKYFKYLPKKIESYVLFKGQIRLNP